MYTEHPPKIMTKISFEFREIDENLGPPGAFWNPSSMIFEKSNFDKISLN